MAKLYLSEMSAVLAEKHGIDRRKAQRFVTSVVSVVQSGLEADRMVKIKGLGTFKVIDVEARESVNVNTGERLVIDGHSKLTFLPDNAMKELVNKPFSQFETVVLNDGVTFNEDPEEEPTVPEVEEPEEEPATPEVEEQEEESATPEVEVPEEEPATPEVEEPEEEPATPEAEELEEELAIPDVEEPEEEAEAPVETFLEIVDEHEETAAETEEPTASLPPGWVTSDEAEGEEANRSNPFKEVCFGWTHLVLTALLALLVGFGVGYMIGHDSSLVPEEQPQVHQVTPSEPKVEDPTATEETAEAADDAQMEAADAMPIWEKYNDMDPRTRNGYYYITGLDRTESAKAGDTSARISRRVFGAAELACYIEVFNGIDGSTVLEEGTEVKIPKIEPKKSVRKRLEKQNNQQ